MAPTSRSRHKNEIHPAAILPPPQAQTQLRRRRTHLSPKAAHQSWLAALTALILYIVRSSHQSSLRQSLLHESFTPPPPLSSLLHTKKPPLLHIYTAPKPFQDADKIAQLHALESWLALTPRPHVTLLGNARGYAEIARLYTLNHRPDIDTTFQGVPILPSLLANTNSTVSPLPHIAVFLNADIVLHDDLPYALEKLIRDFPPGWLAVAARWDVSSLPHGQPILGPNFRPDERVRHDVLRYARSHGVLHTYGGIDLWAWDVAAGPLLDAPIPPFVYGRGKYDNWLTHEVIRAGKRVVVDVSEACTLVHIRHDHHLVAGRPGYVKADEDDSRQFWSSDARGKFELFVNSYLAATHGTYTTQMGTILHAPLKLTSCYEHDGLCIFKRVRPHACRCEHSAYVAKAQNDPYIVPDSRVVFCGLLSSNYGSEEVDGRDRWAISGRVDEDEDDIVRKEHVFGLPLLRDQIFRVISRRTDTNRVLLVVADYSERILIMELACSLRAAGAFMWLVIAALDDELYRFCITRGLPVYLSEFDESEFRDHANFRELARFQVTYEFLVKGKEVYSIEPGTVFLSSPWEYLSENVVGDLHVAVLPRISNASEVGREKSYISAALVFMRPSELTLSLLKKVLTGLEKHDAKSGMLLRFFGCGERNEGVQDLGCTLPGGPTIHIADKEMFRTIELGDCPECENLRNPIAYYSAAFGLQNNVAEALRGLKDIGLSRVDGDANYCRYKIDMVHR